ncbi:hypothetical protein B9W14_04460 [Clostridium drakei]|uniref:Lipoprotein n=1 Tax=Clostridium drakei TaxID=332101 RepID=A0A2U8DLY6_9CLOT|nr:hypothetical protein [Clostridium drakei]AWI03770.1 hypothetical protein B9W14_04460 [Clostridium drakei]
MFSIKNRRRSKGFIIIYVMFIVSFCIFIALSCFKLEVLKRQNNLNMEKSVLKVDPTQKIKEYMLTELDELLYKDVTTLTNDEVKNYLSSKTGSIVQYDNSYIKYDTNNYLVLMYNVNNKFCKEEHYQYKVENNFIFYRCID